MNYGLIYTIPFATLDNNPCVVEIEKEDYVGEVTELTAGDTPFIVDIDSEEFLYTPTRFSTAKLQVVGSDYLQALFSTEYRQYRVTLKVDGVISWCGFIKPELYTQDYTAETFILEIECTSAISILEFIDYTTEGADKSFVSIWSLLKRCIETSYGKYPAIHIPYVYAANKTEYLEGGNILSRMLISEQNFFDEDSKPMKLKEVLEEICKFLNWTCVDWKGELYFVDVDHSGVYHKYDVSLTTKVDEAINSLTVQDISFSGSDHSLDILPGYNKATVKCSNYSIGDVFPVEEFSKLTRLGDKTTHAREYVDGNKIARKMYFLPCAYKMYHYESGTIQNEVSEEAIKNMALDDVDKLLGAIPIKRCNYDMQNINGVWKPNITNYNYDDLIQIRSVLYPVSKPVSKPDYVLNSNKPILTFTESLPPAVYQDGAFAIQGSIQLVRAMSNSLTHYDPISEMYSFGEDLPTLFVSPYFVCRLSIGSMYWNGTIFVNTPSTFRVYTSDGKDDQFNHPVSGNFLNIKSTKTLSMPYDGLDGYIIPIGGVLSGQLKFTINSFYAESTGAMNCFLKGLKCVFQQMDGYLAEGESDRIYENVPNEHYINELDEIIMKISSYNNDCASYGKVLLNGNFLTNNLYSCILDKQIRPEEQLLNRIINHYSATRIKLTQVIKNSDEISPLTILSDTFLVNKKFINMGGSINYKMNRFECIMIEI